MSELLYWSVQKRKILDLKEFYKNPRQISKKQQQFLKNSIERFGYVELAVIDTDNTILAGHMRINILKKQKVKEIEVIVPSRPLTENEREAYVITSNKVTGEWDYDILANEWNAEDLVSYGFDPQELFDSTNFEKSIEEQKEKKKKQHECPSCGFKFF